MMEMIVTIRAPKPETTRQKLDRRIRNQRIRLRQMETFHWGSNHLTTIKSYCSLLKRHHKLLDELRQAKAEIEQLGQGSE